MKLSRKLMMITGGGSGHPDFLELISTTDGQVSDSSANFNIALPALEPNDLVVVSLAIPGNNPSLTPVSSGWTVGSALAGTVLKGVVLTKVVDGSESVISCTGSKRTRVWVVRVYRSKTGRIPKISVTPVGGNNLSAWDLPAITPDSGVHGVQKFTFIAAFACGRALTSAPSGYSNYAQRSYNNYANESRAVIAQHESEAASDDPGTFNWASGAPLTLIQLAIWED